MQKLPARVLPHRGRYIYAEPIPRDGAQIAFSQVVGFVVAKGAFGFACSCSYCGFLLPLGPIKKGQKLGTSSHNQTHKHQPPSQKCPVRVRRSNGTTEDQLGQRVRASNASNIESVFRGRIGEEDFLGTVKMQGFGTALPRRPAMRVLVLCDG